MMTLIYPPQWELLDVVFYNMAHGWHLHVAADVYMMHGIEVQL